MSFTRTWLQNFILYLFLFLIPVQLGTYFFTSYSYIDGIRIDYLAPAFYLTDILFLLIFSLAIFKKQFKLKDIFLKIRKNIFLKILIIGLILNCIFSLEPLIAFYRLLKIVEVVSIYFIFIHAKLSHLNILRVLISSATLQLVLVVYQVINGHTVQGLAYYLGERTFSLSTPGIAKISLQGIEILRGYGSFSHPNSLAGFYLLLLAFVLFNNKFTTFTVLKNVFVGLATMLVVLSFSKIAIVGLLIITGFAVIKSNIDCTLCKISRIIIPFTLTLLVFTAQGDVLSGEKRIWLMESAIKVIGTHPISGVGLGNYLLAQSLFPIPYSYYFLQPVHNIFILLIAEIGIPFFIYISLLIGRVLRNIYMNPPLLSILFVLIYTGMFDHYWLTLQQNTLLIPVIFGLLQKDGHVVK